MLAIKYLKFLSKKNLLGFEEINIGDDDIFNVKLFPNPIQNRITINLFVPNTDEHVLEINDLLGRNIKRIKINKPTGNHSVIIDLPNISSGEYILSIKSNQNYYSNKIIIKK